MTMPIPQLPTDNMYKFVALAGVATVVASIALSVQLAISHGSELRRIQEDLNESVEARATKLGIAAHRLKTFGGDDEPTAELKNFIEKNEGYANRRAQVARQNHLIATVALGSLLGASGVFAACGFWLWYVQVQRFQDGILRAQYDQEIAKVADLQH